MATIADRLASPNLLGGMNIEDLARRFGTRGAPSGNPVGFTPVSETAYGKMFPNGPISLDILRQSTNPAVRDLATGTPEEVARKRDEHARNLMSTLYPTDQGVRALREYVDATYPDGSGMPGFLREVLDIETRGGLNDSGLASVVQRDVARRQRAGLPVPTQRTAPVVTGGAGTSTNIGTPLPTYLQEVADAPVALGKAQNAEALAAAQEGGGLLGDLVPAALALVNPAAGALAGGLIGLGEQDPFKIGGSILGGAAATGAFDDLLAKGKNALGLSEKGFTNPDALGLTRNPGALESITPNFASGTVPTSNIPWIRGFEGITGNALGNLGLKGLEAGSKLFAQNYQPVPGFEMLDPKNLYQSPALGEVSTPSADGTDILDALTQAGVPAGVPSTSMASGTGGVTPSTTPGGAVGTALATAPLTSSGSTDMTPLFGELARNLQERPGLRHKTRPGAFYNALSMVQPRVA